MQLEPEHSFCPASAAPYCTPYASEYVRDSVVDERGQLQVFNGTFYAKLSSFDPIAGTWQHSTAEFSIVNNGIYGQLVAYGHFVFATDGHGITRIDTRRLMTCPGRLG